MNFVLPTFTHLCDWYLLGSPLTGPPDITGVPVQIYMNSRNSGQFIVPILRFPVGPARASGFNWFTGSCCRIFANSTGKHLDYWMQDPNYIHVGFPNEYIMCEGYQIGIDNVTFVLTNLVDLS